MRVYLDPPEQPPDPLELGEETNFFQGKNLRMSFSFCDRAGFLFCFNFTTKQYGCSPSSLLFISRAAELCNYVQLQARKKMSAER